MQQGMALQQSLCLGLKSINKEAMFHSYSIYQIYSCRIGGGYLSIFPKMVSIAASPFPDTNVPTNATFSAWIIATVDEVCDKY